jgi:hypothetical protein
MSLSVERKAQEFVKIIEESGIEMTPENVLRCIEIAKYAMRTGECSVEVYFQAKQILLELVECPSELLN